MSKKRLLSKSPQFSISSHKISQNLSNLLNLSKSIKISQSLVTLCIVLMSSSSSVSSSFVGDRGLPLKCKCGLGVTIFTSKTAENPGRPFFRCISKRDANSWTSKKDGHLFKWVEDGVLEEIQDALGRIEMMENEINKAQSEANESNGMIQGLKEEAKVTEKELGMLRMWFKVCLLWLCVMTIVMVYVLFGGKKEV